MRLLALDLARTFGWAVGSPRGVEAFGHHIFDRTASWALGEYGMQARMTFRRMLKEVEPDAVVYEAPILRPGKIKTKGNRQFVATVDTPEKLRKIYGLPWELEIECFRAGIPVTEAVIGSVRRHYLMGKVPRTSDEAKGAVFVMAGRRGCKALNRDETDALAVLDYELTMRCPKEMMGQKIQLGASVTLSSRGAGVFVGSRQFFPPATAKAESSKNGGAGPSNASSTATAGPSATMGAGAPSPRTSRPMTSSAKQPRASWR